MPIDINCCVECIISAFIYDNSVIVYITVIRMVPALTPNFIIQPDCMIAVCPIGVYTPAIIDTNVEAINSTLVSTKNLNKSPLTILHIIILYKGVHVRMVNMNSVRIQNTFRIHGLVILNNSIDAIPIPNGTSTTNHFIIGFGTRLVENIIFNQTVFSSNR